MSGQRFALAFESTHAAMAANKALEALRPAMIPTPSALSAGCGMTLRYEASCDTEAFGHARGVEGLEGLASLYAEEDGSYRFVAKL